MATKKVRIRKPNEGEQPGFISKLSKYTESKKEEPKYSDEEKMITSSYIKSVLIGLGNSDEKLSEKLKALAPLAYNPKKISKTDLNEKKSKKPKPTKPDLWSRAKSLAKNKFDVYPSIYANAWAAKWYKSKGGGWRM